ncbi:hypothetical protein AA313_de0204604 [Arthrobotrys entomopaga]|nr:hypothetical protein AA313_de0204604 [Arthrobotrys entomopaga]
MTSTKKKRKPTSSLLARRQSAASSLATTKPLPSKLSRKLIRSHHTAQKRLSQAIQQNDTSAITTLTSQLSSSTGNLEAYQRASVSGQSSKRGGDSSKILVDWFLDLGLPKPRHPQAQAQTPNHVNHPNDRGAPSAYRLLEIGCLSPSNAIHSYFPKTNRTLLDLNSLHPEIIKQDFMTFPVPKSVDEGYDVVSCSLVLNYVPTPAGRGQMLKHISRFMEQALQRREQRLNFSSQPQSQRGMETKSMDTGGREGKEARWDDDSLPALFLVLPAPCVTNSRYLTEEKLQDIMASMGYEVVKRKLSAKLVYYLYKYTGIGKGGAFKKTELLPGGKRNNFAIVVE